MGIVDTVNEERRKAGQEPLTPEEEAILLQGYRLGADDYAKKLKTYLEQPVGIGGCRC